MCEHTRRPKLFCIKEDCQQQQCCACSSCIKATHPHSSDQFLTEKEVAGLLTPFDPAANSHQDQKALILKTYRLLTKLKTEINTRVEEFVVDLMSKVKYPLLYRLGLLDSYRCLRDRNYQRLDPRQFRQFCQTVQGTSPVDLLEQQRECFNCHLQQNQRQLKDLEGKMLAIEKAFGFQAQPDLLQMQQDLAKEADLFARRNKPPLARSLDKNPLIPANLRLNSSLKIDKRQTEETETSKPALLAAFKPEFLTPTKSLALDVSIDNLSSRSAGHSEGKSARVDPPRVCVDSASQVLTRLNTSQSAKRYWWGQEEDARTVRSSGEGGQEIRAGGQEGSADKMLSSVPFQSLFQYKEELPGGFKIKISEQKKQEEELKGSIELGIAGSYRQRIIKTSIREREQNIKNRLAAELKRDLPQDKKDNPKPKVQTENQARDPSPRRSPLKPRETALALPPTISRKDSRELKSPKKKLEAEGRANYLLVGGAAEERTHRRPSFNNVSLNKEVSFEKSNGELPTPLVLAAKQIPLVETRKTRLLRKSTLEITEEQELEGSCLLLCEMARIKGPQKQVRFLEQFLEKYQNCISAAETLSFLYLQLGSFKECLVLCSNYLDRLEQGGCKGERRHLTANKAAALNSLGRYSEAVSFLKPHLEQLESDRLHKNMGDALFNCGTLDRAVYHYEKATKANEAYHQAYYNLAVMLYLQNSYFNARMNIEKALQLEPQNPHYRQLLAAIAEHIANCHS